MVIGNGSVIATPFSHNQYRCATLSATALRPVGKHPGSAGLSFAGGPDSVAATGAPVNHPVTSTTRWVPPSEYAVTPNSLTDTTPKLATVWPAVSLLIVDPSPRRVRDG